MEPPPRGSAREGCRSDRVVPTGYDEQHVVTYLRLLDAEADGADWKDVAGIVLHMDPAREPDRA